MFKTKVKKVINITDRIKTFDDACREIGTTEEKFNKLYNNYAYDTLAYEKLKIIIKALNEGWEPDWSNDNERKWFPYFKGSPFGFDGTHCAFWSTASSTGSRLCLKSEELAKYCGKQFEHIYREYMMIDKKLERRNKLKRIVECKYYMI